MILRRQASARKQVGCSPDAMSLPVSPAWLSSPIRTMARLDASLRSVGIGARFRDGFDAHDDTTARTGAWQDFVHYGDSPPRGTPVVFRAPGRADLK
jgi:hypothetical protein